VRVTAHNRDELPARLAARLRSETDP
jgi:hypothetical protein